MTTSRGSSLLPALWVIAVALACVLGGLNLWFGEFNQDEGWYLYAAREVAAGRRPFLDFAHTQGPVMALVYGALWPLYGHAGMLGGRLLTLVFGLASSAAAAALAARLTPERRRRSLAALAAFILVGVNVYHSYFTTMAKTYALAALLALLGWLCLPRARAACRGAERPAPWRAFSGGILLVLAAATRASLAVLPVLAFLALLGRAVVGDARPSRPAAAGRNAGVRRHVAGFGEPLAFGVGAALAAVAALGPFALGAPRAFRLLFLDYHTARAAGAPLAGLAYKAGFVSRVTAAYFVPLAVLAILAVAVSARARRGRARPRRRAERLARLMPGTTYGGLGLAALAVLAVSLVHLLAPFPYDDYQTVVFPLFGAALAAAAASLPATRAAMTMRGARLSLPVLLLLATAAAFSSPLNQAWFIGARDRIWWPLREEAPMAAMRRTGRRIRDLAGDGAELLTQDTYLAVEAGLRVPPGFEMGPFSYFPDWPADRAAACHVLDRATLRDRLENSRAPVAAISGYAFAIASPGVVPLPEAETAELVALLETRYRLVETIPRVGQADTDVRLYVRRAPPQKFFRR